MVRSRYATKEFANTKSDDFFSITLPLEALRLLLSHAASGRSSSTGGRKVLVVDARQAHWHAFAERNLARGPCARYVCTTEAKLIRRSRRTREMGIFSLKAAGEHGICERVGQPMPLSTQRQVSELCVSFLLVWSLTWTGPRQQMEKSFLVKVIGRLEGDKQDVREIRELNRVLSWRSGGVQLEADPRHQEILISELEQDVRGLSTPGVKNPQGKDGDGDGEMRLRRAASDRQQPVQTTSRWTDQTWSSQPQSCAEECRHRRNQT